MSQKVFLDYDQAALDGQLNLRARWPEHPEYFARWAADSAEVRSRHGGDLDLAYGAAAGETLDLFRTAGPEAAPLMVFIHGGYWQGLDKNDFSYLAPPFLEAGIAFCSVNYDLAPKVSIEEIVRQVRAAHAWLYRNGAARGIDPDRIFVSGHSAGGHLTAMVLATDWQGGGFGVDLPADLVKGGCSVSGVYDLEAIRLSYHNDVVKLDPEMARRMSPLDNLPPRRAGPVILALGSEETEEFHRQQAEYAAACRGAGLEVSTVDLPGRNHFSAIDALGELDNSLFGAARSLVSSRP